MKKVLLLLAEGFEVFEASVFIDVIGWNNEYGDKSTQLFTCALRKEIKSTFNQRFIVDYCIDEIDVDEFDAIAIPGGFEVYGFYNDASDDSFLELIKSFKAKDKIVASICVGALPVAKSGILQGKNGTTYDSDERRKSLAECGVNVIHEPIVQDDNIITSWNPSTAINVALLLLELLTTTENASHIRKIMGFNKEL